jgi:hypothetical protein
MNAPCFCCVVRVARGRCLRTAWTRCPPRGYLLATLDVSCIDHGHNSCHCCGLPDGADIHATPSLRVMSDLYRDLPLEPCDLLNQRM